MKKYSVFTGISFLALLIVLPVTCFVNHGVYNPAFSMQTIRADGSPLPAPIPHIVVNTAPSASTLIADGSPLPAPIPHRSGLGNPLA